MVIDDGFLQDLALCLSDRLALQKVPRYGAKQSPPGDTVGKLERPPVAKGGTLFSKIMIVKQIHIKNCRYLP